ncbi:MAG: TolC family protein [Kiritimatiellia bacterium]
MMSRTALHASLLLSVCAALLTGCASIREGVDGRHVPVGISPSDESVENRSLDLPALRDDSSLDDYLKYAALNNPGLEAAFSRWKAALERIPQAKSLPDPRFNYAYFIENVETRVGPQEQKLGLSQTFPWFGKLSLKGDIAGEMAAAEREAYEKTKLRLFYEVKAAYHDYYYLARSLTITKEHLKLVGNLEAVARTRFKTGTAPHGSVVQAQVELGKLADRLKTLESLRKPITARLNAALNRSTHSPLPWPKALPYSTLGLTDEAVRELLIQHNPDLKRLERLAAKEGHAVALARKEYFPDITVGAEYVSTGEANMPDVADSGKDPVMAMISVNIPIWYGKYRAAEREAMLQLSAVRKEKGDFKNRLLSGLELALYHFRDAERKVDLYRDTLIPKAEESRKVAQQGFEAGKVTFISLIDAERILLEFRLAAENALAEKGKRRAELEMLTGSELTGKNE